jgi:hypothetical protein
MHSQRFQIFKFSFVRIIVMVLGAVLILAALPSQVTAQQNNVAASATPSSASASGPAMVPQIIQFAGQFGGPLGGTANGGSAPVPAGTISITFTLYENEQGGTALWSETQNVQVDAQGHYTALLGSTSPEGLPLSLFTTGQAHWLAVQPLLQGFGEQPRVLMVSVPYALKALDAETIGGKPASAFMPAPVQEATSSPVAAAASASSALMAGPASGSKTGTPPPANVTGSGMPGFLPIWQTSTSLANSLLFENAAHNTVGMMTRDGTIAFSVNQTGTGTGIQSITTSGDAIVGLPSATSGSANGVAGQVRSTSGNGVVGIALSTTGDTSGVLGQDASDSGFGVSGAATSSSGPTTGVFGSTDSTDGAGVYGSGVAASALGASVTFRPLGVWGDTTGNSGTGAAVLGTIDDGIAVAGYSAANSIATASFTNDTTSHSGVVFAAHGGKVGGTCLFDVSGNLACTGSKSAVVPVDGGSRQVALYAVEAPENWFEDFGSGQLSGGTASITLEPNFAQTVNTSEDYHVFLTPKGDSEGLYVNNETPQGFEVHEQRGGHSNVAFDYRIVARRKGFEKIRMADKTQQFQDVAATSERGRAGGKRPPRAVPPVVPAIGPTKLVPAGRSYGSAKHN